MQEPTNENFNVGSVKSETPTQTKMKMSDLRKFFFKVADLN